MEKNYFSVWRKTPKRRYVKVFCLCFFLVSISNSSLAVPKENVVESTQQAKTVKGTVLDPSGEPIIGANVKVEGAGIGTITDLDGNFTLSVPVGKKVEISFIGYITQVVNIPANGVIKVSMSEDSKLLDEVVVVGYGTQRVKDLTGAATMVKVDEIPDIPGASLVDALAGQVVGLSVKQSDGRPGSTGTFKVRQPMTFGLDGGYTQPLVVIDDVVQVDYNGEPTMQGFNMLDISEIESMTVLKDASAAIYGSRASAGVILVKTKRGTAGQTKISYSGKLDFSDAVSHINTMNAYETGIFTNRIFKQTDTNNKTNSYIPYMYSDSELEAMKNLNYNWLDEAWHSSVSNRHSLSVNGGSDKATFFAGITYQNQDTNLGKLQDYDKWTFRTGGELKVANGLKLSASISAFNTKKIGAKDQVKIAAGPWGSSSASNDYTQLRHVPGYIPITQTILDPVTNEMKEYFMSPWGGPKLKNVSTDSNLGSGYAAWNFFANEASKARTENEDNGYDANFALSYDVPFIKGLTFKATYAVGFSNSYNNTYGDYYQILRANNTDIVDNHLINPNTTWTVLNYGDPNGTDISKKPNVTYTKNTGKTEQMNFMFNYDRTFGDHEISLTGVVERGEGEGHKEVLMYDGIGRSYNGSSTTAGTLNSSGKNTYFSKYESGSLSYVGRANYKFADRYLAQFLIRSDASTKFAPENYWGTFMTGSLGWIVSEEKFFKNSALSGVIDYLKLRGSLGTTGKDEVEPWKWMQIYVINSGSGIGFGSLGGQQANGGNLDGLANRDIRWDTTVKQNYGIDVNVLQNRLSLSADFYYDKTHDLVMTISDSEEPMYLGAKLAPENYGKKDAWGFEFSARWSDKINQSILPSWGPIRYGVGMDYSISWNKTVLGQQEVFDYPGYMNEKSEYTGYRGPHKSWGFLTWKGTSGGDGILRTQADIDNYWQYLTDLATAAGKSPSYLGVSTKDKMYVGMLAYQDIAGDIDQKTKTIAGPNGIITNDHAQDYAPLADNRVHSILTKLNLQWGDFSWSANVSTSWGGFEDLYHDGGQGAGDFQWSHFSYLNDMFDPTDNPMGKYPSVVVGGYANPSDFWQVSSFRMYVRNMTFAYTLPKNITKKVGVDKLAFNLTGNNLWDFYNPYPGKFRNMYDDCKTAYPTLRTWTFGVNLTF